MHGRTALLLTLFSNSATSYDPFGPSIKLTTRRVTQMEFSLHSEDVRWVLTVYFSCILYTLKGTCFIRSWWPPSGLCWTTRSTVCWWELVTQTRSKLNCPLRSGCWNGEMALHWMPPCWSPCLCWGCFLVMHDGDCLADAYVFLAAFSSFHPLTGNSFRGNQRSSN